MLSCKELLVVLIVLAATCCGQDTEDEMNDGRIIGGEDINIKDYSYLVWLQRLDNMESPGATVVIHPYWLISSTLAITNGTGELPKRHELHVLAGNIKTTKCGKKAHIRNVANYFIQPGFTASNGSSLTMVQLSEPLDFGRVIGSIGIPTVPDHSEPKVGEQCKALSRNFPRETDEYIYKMIILTIQPLKDCRYRDFNYICTHQRKKTDRKNCVNSRAALVCKGILVGISIMQSGLPCGASDSYMNFIRVDSDLPWINRMIATTSKVTHKDVATSNNATAAPAASSGHDFTAPLILVLAAAVLTVAK